MKKRLEKELWEWFSRYIRLRDSKDGVCKCITCGAFRRPNGMDCGHFVSRQYKYTKFNEKNNHAQCKQCNGFEEGNKYTYGKEINRRYGEGTAELLEGMKNKPWLVSPYDIHLLILDYEQRVNKLLEEKDIEKWWSGGYENSRKNPFRKK